MAFRKRAKAINVKSIEQIDGFIAEGKPVLIDFMQFACPACKAMDGTVDELANEFRGSAHVLKVNVGKVPGAAQKYRIKGTPTFVLFGKSKRSKRKAKQRGDRQDGDHVTQRFRTTGVVKKEQLRRLLVTNGAERAN